MLPDVSPVALDIQAGFVSANPQRQPFQSQRCFHTDLKSPTRNQCHRCARREVQFVFEAFIRVQPGPF